LDRSETGALRNYYFLADKGSPNLYSGAFSAPAGPTSFWVNPGVATFDSPYVAPFFSFDVYKDNFFGPAYSINNTGPNGPTNLVANFLLQLVSIVKLVPKNVVGVRQLSLPGYTFVTALIDPKVDPDNNLNPAYVVGWSPYDAYPLRIFRTFITLGFAQPNITFLGIESFGLRTIYRHCFDQFTETLRPQLNITMDGKIVILVPGRCGFITVLTPIPGVPFGLLPDNCSQTYYPEQLIPQPNQFYISSIIYDFYNNLIFYTTKKYNTPGATLWSFSVNTWSLTSNGTGLDLAESEAVLVLANEVDTPSTTQYLFIIASGADRIQRYTIDSNNNIGAGAMTVLTPDINRISSALYSRPFLYYITYEPDAKIVRIPLTSFCNKWCSTNGYCEQGYCYCQPGFTQDLSDPINPCKSTALVDSQLQEKQSQGAAAALGVLFAFSLVAAIAGWYLWWRGRKISPERKPFSAAASNEVHQNL